ncbi:hypothetical protein H4218_003245 [Coemansia sp. IMI 209128]|nr:hypothetical protein H4218_003245 [Coemansia sp. IMI 209128]
MSISTDHTQLQRQLYLLGYSHTLPSDGVVLVSTLLKDLQASLDRVKELEATSIKLEREERTTRLGHDKAKTELHALRTENNSLRAEVLNHSREADRLRRESRADQYRLSKTADDLRMANLQLKAENAELTRVLGDGLRRCETRLTELDPRGKIARVAVNRAIDVSRFATTRSAHVQPAIVDLVDLSSRRIGALEHEIEHLEGRLAARDGELKAALMDVKERDLELLRVNSEFERMAPSRDDESNQVPRLNDQVEYLHERAEALEQEAKDQREQFAREKEDLHNRWVAAENERVAASDSSSWRTALMRIRDSAAQLARSGASNAADRLRDECQRLLDSGPGSLSRDHGSPSPQTGSPSLSADVDVERLRTELANIKSLYAQTRDQLQELLRSGNAESREAIEKARQAEAASQKALRDLQKQLEGVSEYRDVAEARAKEISRLEDRLRKAEAEHRAELNTHLAEIGRLSTELKQSSESLQKANSSVGERQSQHEGLLAEYQQLVEQHRKLDKSLKQAVGEVGEWRAKADEREHRTSELARRADEYKLLYRQNSSELNTCKKTLEAFTSDLNTLREAHANDQREVERLGGELEQALRMRQAVEMSKDEYKAGLAKALSENEAHRSLVAHLQAERSALRVQVKAQFHLSQRLEQRLEALDPSHADVTLAHPLPLSRSSSAAHSSRSFSSAK